MLKIARVVCGAVLAVVITGAANAAVVDLPLYSPGNVFSQTRTVSGGSPFDQFNLTIDQDLRLTAGVTAGSGISGLMMTLYNGATAVVSGVTAFARDLIFAPSEGPYSIVVDGAGTGDYSIFLAFTAADPNGDPVGSMPIPGAALLLGSGLAVLIGASRKTICAAATAKKA